MKPSSWMRSRREPAQDWDLIVRPRRSTRYVFATAAVLVIVFVVLAVLLRTSATGVYFRLADQLSMVGIGLAMAGGVSLLARPRLRAGAQGVTTRNAFSEITLEWNQIWGLSFPDGSSWARIELADDEYIPAMAIQANDGEYAATAVERFRALHEKYAEGPPS